MNSRIQTLMSLAVALGTVIASLPTARADVISDWSKTAFDYFDQHAPANLTRGMIMVHVAQFDAVNAVVGGYMPYALNVVAPSASAEAAAAQAAYVVATNISRASLTTLNNALNRSLAEIPAGQAKDDGIAIGRLAAQAIITLRAADNMDLKIPAPTSTALGKWRTTPPNFTPGDGAQYRYFLPWTMRAAAQFRPGPPPALPSEQYAADLNEVRLLGALVSDTRTSAQTEAAKFFFPGSRAILEPVLAQRSLPLAESARMFALFYMIFMDSQIAFLEAQYAYSFWRPITAIRNGEKDGNDATPGDAAWTPLLETPNHPEYPSGTCTLTSGLVHFLISVYGNDFSFTSTSNNTTKPREFARLSAMIDDAVEARIAAGAHFRTSCLVGVELGRQIAANAMANFLRPAPRLVATPPKPGEFQLHLQAGRAIPYAIETSADLKQWAPWKTDTYGMILVTDPDAATTGRRFYRAAPLGP